MKTKLIIITSLFIISFIACNKKDEKPTLQVGQPYQGGLILYIDGSGKHGLIISPYDMPSTTWGCVDVSIPGASGTLIGTGKANTAAIIAACSDTGTAARLADAYVLEGYSDWYLPSKNELLQLSKDWGISWPNPNFGLTNDYLWSSSQTNGSDAFNYGKYYGDSRKNNLHSFRCVRNF